MASIKLCEVIAMPFYAGLFAGAVKRDVIELEQRVTALEVEVMTLKTLFYEKRD
jgi:hypothetical protein